MIEPGEGMPIASVTEEIGTIRKRFPDIPAAELNGRMKPEEKNRVMQDFLEGACQDPRLDDRR
jgi:RecG-like helicase